MSDDILLRLTCRGKQSREWSIRRPIDTRGRVLY